MSDRVTTAARNGTRNDRDVLNGTHDMVFVLDADGRFLDFVPSSTLDPAMAPSDFIGSTLHEVFPDGFGEWALLHVKQAIETRENQLMIYCLPVNGQDFGYEARIVPVDGNRVIAVVRDISSVKETVVRSTEDLDLQRALKHQEFVLYYQPQLAIDTRQIIGMEALARWRHPARGILAPSEFIPAMERNGMISLLGAWVMRTACTQNKMWQESGTYRVPVAVNVSAHRFRQLNVDSVRATLEETGLEPRYLRLEITESVVMEDLRHAVSVLTDLRTAGVQIAIDDFGLGYSSLARLKDLPVDEIKIDKAFVQGVGTDPRDRAIVQLTIDLAHALGISVTAEGVETEDQLVVLQQCGCDNWQGYLCTRPLPPDQLDELVRARQ